MKYLDVDELHHDLYLISENLEIQLNNQLSRFLVSKAQSVVLGPLDQTLSR